MLVFRLFFVVASVVFRLRHSRVSVPDLALAFARVEASLCGPPALFPYLQFVCGAVDAIKPSVGPSVVFNFNTDVVYAGLLGASVFDPSVTGCLLNCTSVNEPALVYFGPHQPPAGDCIVAPKFALLAPPPVRRPWERPAVKATLLDLLKSLLTLENLIYFGLLVFGLWRAICDSTCDSTVPEQSPVYLLGDVSIDDIITLRGNFNGPSLVALAMEQPEDELVNVSAVVEPVVQLVGNEEVAPVVEEPVTAVFQEVAEVAELPTVQDGEPRGDVAEDAPAGNDVALDNEEPACPSSPAVASPEEHTPEAHASLPVVDQPEDEVLPPQQSALPLEAVQHPAEAIAPAVEDAPAPTPSTVVPQVDVPTAASTTSEQAEPATARRPTRCGKRLRTLRRQRALAEAEAAAAAAQEQVEAQPTTAPQQELPHVEEPQEPLTRQQRRGQRAGAFVARVVQSSSAIPEPPRAPAPVFTDDDFPPLPVDPVASKPLEHKMSYALVTAITRPSKTAAIRCGSWTVKINTAQPTTIQEPSPLKWNAASRLYDDTPQDSRWTNWKMNLEDIAIIKPAKTRNVRRSSSRVD